MINLNNRREPTSGGLSLGGTAFPMSLPSGAN